MAYLTKLVKYAMIYLECFINTLFYDKLRIGFRSKSFLPITGELMKILNSINTCLYWGQLVGPNGRWSEGFSLVVRITWKTKPGRSISIFVQGPIFYYAFLCRNYGIHVKVKIRSDVLPDLD